MSSGGGSSIEMSRVPLGYAEHAPPADLAGHVACFWTRLVDELAGPAAGSIHRVLPDGCVDIIVGFDASSAVTSAIGVGAMTKPLIISGDSPRLSVGVRFLPGHAFIALGIPACAITDENVGYDELARDARAELDSMSAQTTNEGRVAAFIDLVRRRLRRVDAVPASVREAVRRIVSANGNLRVAELASEIGITRQQLARHFAMHVGVTPKMLARVMRARAALARADAARAAYPRDVDWTSIAYDLGYYDQPHFIDDFKALTGVTPSRWTG